MDRLEINWRRRFTFYRIASHPVFLIVSYLLLPFFGNGIEGLAVSFVIKGMISNDPNAVIIMMGIIFLLLAWFIYGRQLEDWMEGAMDVFGTMCLLIPLRFMHSTLQKDILTLNLGNVLPMVFLTIFIILFSCHIQYYGLYRLYGWDELEWEREGEMVRRRLLKEQNMN